MNLSSNMEDYLEAVYEIEKEKSAVRVRDVARKLGVTMPSVTGALKNLQALGFIEHHRYEYIHLTEKGTAQAEKISTRHRIMLTFLTGIIGVEPETAEMEACRMEHVLSAETVEKLTQYVARNLARDETDNHDNAE